jgi:hypothetical protein
MANDTAVLLIDPYNDFLHQEGKINPMVADSITHTGTIEHLKEVVAAARKQRGQGQAGVREGLVGRRDLRGPGAEPGQRRRRRLQALELQVKPTCWALELAVR